MTQAGVLSVARSIGQQKKYLIMSQVNNFLIHYAIISAQVYSFNIYSEAMQFSMTVGLFGMCAGGFVISTCIIDWKRESKIIMESVGKGANY